MSIGVRKSHLIHTSTTTYSHKHNPISPNHKHNLPLSSPNSTLTSFPTFCKVNHNHITAICHLMAAMNSSVLACSYVISGTGSLELTSKIVSLPSLGSSALKMPVIRAQKAKVSDSSISRDDDVRGRRAALLFLGAALFAATTSSANAGVIEDALEKSKANKELNDKKRLATSGANFARAYTVQFGSCTFPYNFTGCQDLAKQKKVPFITDDLELECEGKEKYKCGSNVFWKW